MSRDVFARAFEVASAILPNAPKDRLAHPFGFDEHSPHRWRVSPDVWDALCARAGFGKRAPTPDIHLLGEPLEVDPALPPNSMLLEEREP